MHVLKKKTSISKLIIIINFLSGCNILILISLTILGKYLVAYNQLLELISSISFLNWQIASHVESSLSGVSLLLLLLILLLPLYYTSVLHMWHMVCINTCHIYVRRLYSLLISAVSFIWYLLIIIIIIASC